jgi:hypothetical protein
VGGLSLGLVLPVGIRRRAASFTVENRSEGSFMLWYAGSTVIPMSTMQLAPDSIRFRKREVTASSARSIPARRATRNEDPSRRVLSPPNWSVSS